MAAEKPLVTGRKKTKLDQVADICRATVREAKLGDSRTQGLINSTGFKAEFRGLVEKHAVQVFKPNKWQQRAIGILGKENIVCPQEITNIRGLAYPGQLLEAFDEAVADRKALRWCSEHGYAIVADPPTPYTILEVRAIKPETFNTRMGGWYAGAVQKFAHEEKILQGSLTAFGKTVVFGSTSKMSVDQDKLISPEEFCPNSADLSWFITTMMEVRRIRLFTELWARTSSVDSNGYRVLLRLIPDGLHVYDWLAFASAYVGLTAARKFPKR